MTHASPLPWLAAHEEFPNAEQAWGSNSDAPGLLAAGGSLDVATLQKAYSQGIFPWYSAGQPVLWWSPDPRMVLKPADFELHHSLRKRLQQFIKNPACSIQFNSAFERVIQNCSNVPRQRQTGSWIVPEMVQAYTALHQSGLAHSVETWIDNELVGGLYCVNIGRMIFGESMFSHQTDASKIALAALVAFCRACEVEMIDCQQNTRHLASLGAKQISRTTFLAGVQQYSLMDTPRWKFDLSDWKNLNL